MKSTVFSVVTSLNVLVAYQCLEARTSSILRVEVKQANPYHIHLQSRRISEAKRHTVLACLAYDLTMKMEAVRSLETSVNSYRLYGVRTQKVVIFIPTAVRTSILKLLMILMTR
jgi:hypothetical protein